MNTSNLIRNIVTSGIIAANLISGLLSNGSLLALISFAEIIQFLCIFALICLKNYPTSINILYNAQINWNFNFISIPSFFFIKCEDFKSDEMLPFNYNNHPAISCTNFLCNILPIAISMIFPISIYILCSIIKSKITIKIKKSYEWNGFIQLQNSCFIIIVIISFVGFFFVILI